MNDAESSKGRTAAFEPANEGSNPSSATKEYHQKWYQDNKEHRKAQISARRNERRIAAREFICNYLQSHPCLDCGETDIVVLEFDHVRGEKKRTISLMVAEGYTIKSIQAEIEKCEVACANCHRRRTAQRAGHYRTGFES